MSDLFMNAAALLRAAQPERATEPQARALLEALEYLPTDRRPARETDRGAERSHRARLLEAAARFTRIFELSAPEAPGLVCFGGEVDPVLVDPMHQGSPLLGVSGVGLSLQEAFQRCVGEAVEYLSHLQSSDDVLVQLADAPTAVERRLPDFVARLAVRADTRLSWYSARRLTDGREVLLPADLCLRRPEGQRDFDPPFPLSIGSAASTSWHGAALHGLFELIERDAASLWWRGGRRGRTIAQDVGMDALLARLRPAGSAQRRTWLLDITTDLGVPSVVAASCRADGFGFAFGLASRPTLAAAARSAVLELCQLELAYVVIEAKRKERGESSLNAKDHVHLQRATAINADQCMLLQPVSECADHLVIDTADPRATLEAVARHLELLEIETFCLDLTRSRFQIPVARIVAPSLQLEPSAIVTSRLANTIARTGGGAAYTGGVSLL